MLADYFRSMPNKMKWPPTEKIQDKFKENAKSGYNYTELKKLIPGFDKDKVCLHGNPFDAKDPKKMMWVLSRKVIIYNTEYIPANARVVYYRPTVDKACDCKETWTGEDYLLLNVNRGRTGRTTHLITYNLLLNYTYAFTKGMTQRGFLASHNTIVV